MIDLRKLAHAIIYLIVIGIMALVLFGCHDAKYHEQKFYDKGGQFNCKVDTIKTVEIRVDTLGVTHYDTIYKIVVDEHITYVPKWQTKIEYKYKKTQLEYEYKNLKAKYKHEKDSLSNALKTLKIENDKLTKLAKIEANKVVKETRAKSNWWIWLVTGIVLDRLIRYFWIIVKAFQNLPTKFN